MVQPNVIDGPAGVQAGNSLQITPEGAVSTQRQPTTMIRCAKGRRSGSPAVEMRGISKAFADTVANDSVDFSVRSGTYTFSSVRTVPGRPPHEHPLRHILPDAGVILVDGEEVEISAPNDAIAHGSAWFTNTSAWCPHSRSPRMS